MQDGDNGAGDGGGWGWGESPDDFGDAAPMALDDQGTAAPGVAEQAAAFGPELSAQPPMWQQPPPAPVPNAAPPWQTEAPGPLPPPSGMMVPQRPMAPQGPMVPPMGGPRGMPPGYHPAAGQVGVMPHEGSHMLGLSALAVGVGALIGWRYGGAYASIAGGLLGGSAVNAYRALYYYKEGTPEGDKEAAVSATYAVLTTAVGGYLIATRAGARGSKDELTPNPDGEDDDEDELGVEPAGPCALRPVGPTILPPESAWAEEPGAEE